MGDEVRMIVCGSAENREEAKKQIQEAQEVAAETWGGDNSWEEKKDEAWEEAAEDKKDDAWAADDKKDDAWAEDTKKDEWAQDSNEEKRIHPSDKDKKAYTWAEFK